MPTTTNYGWTTPADTDLVKDGAAAIRTLGSSIDTTVFNNANAAIAKTIVDAKGDIIAATAADTVARLASSGNNGDLLTVDTSTATGLKWAAPAASGGMTLISEQTASASTSLTFGSIPGTYKQLYLLWTGVYTSDNSDFALRINNDSGTNYYGITFGSSGGSFTSGQSNGGTTIFTLITNVTGTGLYETGVGFIVVDNYASTTKKKAYFAQRGFVRTSTFFQLYQGIYDSTSAVTSLDIVRTGGTGTFSNVTNTSFRLYGVS